MSEWYFTPGALDRRQEIYQILPCSRLKHELQAGIIRMRRVGVKCSLNGLLQLCSIDELASGFASKNSRIHPFQCFCTAFVGRIALVPVKKRQKHEGCTRRLA